MGLKKQVTVADVDPLVRQFLYQILQKRSGWLSLTSDTIFHREFRGSYIKRFWRTEDLWKRRCSNTERQSLVKRVNAAIQHWLSSFGFHDYCFSHIEEMITPEVTFATEREANRDPEKCPDDCEFNQCINVALLMECEDECQSRTKCSNQFAQHLQDWTERLEVRFVSREIGAGLFTKVTFRMGTILGQFLGEAIQEDEYERRIESPLHKSYMLTVGATNFHSIDPTAYGNFTRFINHSCSPNCCAETWLSQKRWIVVIRALREISEVICIVI